MDMTIKLPSKAAFLKKQVVPATVDDRHYNDKCIFCWDRYSAEHPAAKFLPCGHVFGHTCISQIVEGPTGDLCPLCRVKLFRPDLSVKFVTSFLWNVSVSAAATYVSFVYYSLNCIHRAANNLLPPLLNQFLALASQGPQLWVGTLVRYCTDIESRNPNLRVFDAFIGTGLSDFLVHGLVLAPFHLLVYYVLGFRTFKAIWFAHEMGISWIIQHLLRTTFANGKFNNSADRAMVECLVDISLAVKGLILAAMLCSWGEPSVTLLGSVWDILATVVWR
ncbi:hypothetical protein SVAN01_03573 [Stagonosporopsis vannaccii]|nr:hypothetical protein SVAN01_03573 [Stagonosporopsis vannaccii]